KLFDVVIQLVFFSFVSILLRFLSIFQLCIKISFSGFYNLVSFFCSGFFSSCFGLVSLEITFLVKVLFALVLRQFSNFLFCFVSKSHFVFTLNLTIQGLHPLLFVCQECHPTALPVLHFVILA